MARKILIGDIIEISTSKGFVYAQYTHQHEMYGGLIRILDGFFVSRPCEFDELVKQRHKFVVFFPLRAAVSRKIFEIVAHCEVPEEAKTFPIFRSGPPDRNGKVANWWLWDGTKEWMIGKLTDEQRKIPIRSILNDTALIERIESGWTPELDRRS
jgi:hypothetical protein